MLLLTFEAAKMAKAGPLPHPKLDKLLSLVSEHLDSLNEGGENKESTTRIMVAPLYYTHLANNADMLDRCSASFERLLKKL